MATEAELSTGSASAATERTEEPQLAEPPPLPATATEQTPEIPADAEATMQDPGNASILRCSDSAVEPDAATEHIPPASFGSAGEASSGCGDMTIKSLDDVVSKLSSDCDDSAAALRNAVQTLQRGVQAEIRNLCKPWGVQLTAKNDNGKYGKRADDVLKSELKDTFIAKAKKHFRAKATENQPLEHALTEHTRAIQLKKRTEAPASSAATEHAETEFHIDEALAETLRSLQALGTQQPILTRVIDHACSSEHCMSYRLVAMLRLAHWNISADLCNDQPLDACGYIAADAVCRLRDAALSEANSWHDIQLPDYAQLACSRGNQVLRKRGDHRILDTDEVNRLVRHYSHLDQRHQAAEEWWAGAVALDHFLTGLPNIVKEITVTCSHTQHRWRGWAVNTQTSRQHGSHWFTVVVGTQTQLLQSTAEPCPSASSSGDVLPLLMDFGPRLAGTREPSVRCCWRGFSWDRKAAGVAPLPMIGWSLSWWVCI